MRPEFPYWVIPHIVGAIIVGGLNFKNPIPDKVKIPLYAFISTICEQATMLIGALFILSLPWTIFAAAFPLMLYERLIGTIGGTLLTYSFVFKMQRVFRFKGSSFQLDISNYLTIFQVILCITYFITISSTTDATSSSSEFSQPYTGQIRNNRNLHHLYTYTYHLKFCG